MDGGRRRAQPVIRGIGRHEASPLPGWVIMDTLGMLGLGQGPTQAPSLPPTQAPSQVPTQVPTELPTQAPTQAPTDLPTQLPTAVSARGTDAARRQGGSETMCSVHGEGAVGV